MCASELVLALGHTHTVPYKKSPPPPSPLLEPIRSYYLYCTLLVYTFPPFFGKKKSALV